MQLRGACSNPQVAPRVEAAAGALRALLQCVDHGPLPARPALRLPMGAIRTAAVAALADAGRPLRCTEVRLLVEQRLDRHVSQDTVSSFLSVASRHPSMPLERVGRGLYAALGA